MNIIQDVGKSHFMQRFNGNIFIGPSGQVHFIDAGRRFKEGMVPCVEVSGVGSKASTRNVEVPDDFFMNFRFMDLPRLGYRTSDKGQVLCFFERKNTSYTRGYSFANCIRSYAPHTELIFEMERINKTKMEDNASVASLIAKPEYLSMQEGLEAINNGKIYCFANSPEVAIVPENEDKYNVIFKKVHVADVTPEGQMTFIPEFNNLELEFMV